MGRVKDENMDLIEARSREPRDMDEEANAFAMELLMPERFLRADVERLGGIDLEDDKSVAKLAKKYRVSNTAMAIRLGQLSRVISAS